MTWIQRLLVGGLALLTLPGAGRAQSGAVAARAGSGPLQLTLGASVVDLFGPWRFHTGDDPGWAKPDFDDSGWSTIDLHSPDGLADADLGTSGYVPGWTAQGYPKHAGYAWYRLRVDVQGARTGLSLRMPGEFDDAYQVFVDGQQIGAFGRFGPRGVTTYSALPRGFKFPPNLRSGPIVIAIRMWMDSSSRFSIPEAGGLHGPPILGLAPAVAKQVRLDWDDVAHGVGSGFLEMLVLLLALAVALTHFWLDRSDKAYLWLGLVCLATLLGNLVVLSVNFTTAIPLTAGVILKDVVFTPVRIGLWVLFWAAWFRLGPPAWLQRAVWALVVALAAGTLLLRPPLHGQFVPLHASAYLLPLVLWVKLGLAALLIWVVYRGIRLNRAEGWLTLPAVLLAVCANYAVELRLMHVPITYSVLRFRISLGETSTVLSLLLITLMGSRRFLLAQRRKVQYQLEIEQARELQKVILPTTLPQVPGLRVESEYRPSREVGGDFFQIIPDRGDGSVLVVVGDVTGKGLRAGMLVALIVGAIDTAAKETPDPAYLLQTLNDRLCERGYATATCLILKIAANGLVTVANAGHLPPFLNGKELEMEGALPLGTLGGEVYPPMRFYVEEGDALVLMTDGIVEAQDGEGTLFGFERTREMIAGKASPAEIASAAQQFGQEDDILILRLERVAVRSAVAGTLQPAMA